MEIHVEPPLRDHWGDLNKAWLRVYFLHSLMLIPSAIWSVKSYWRCYSYMYKKSRLAKKNLFELEFLLGMRLAKSMKLPKKKKNLNVGTFSGE